MEKSYYRYVVWVSLEIVSFTYLSLKGFLDLVQLDKFSIFFPQEGFEVLGVVGGFVGTVISQLKLPRDKKEIRMN